MREVGRGRKVEGQTGDKFAVVSMIRTRASTGHEAVGAPLTRQRRRILSLV